MINIWNGAYAVTKEGQVTTPLCSIRSFGSPWSWMGKIGTKVHRWTNAGKWSTTGDHHLDIIFTSRDKHEAIAFAQAYLDRLDKPNRRGHVWPKDNEGWGPWETDHSTWNTSTHDIQFECIAGIHRIRRRERKDLLPKKFWVYGDSHDDLKVCECRPSMEWKYCFEVERKE